jgi:multisubunit Na+/H+ antiporter MnhB subunit
MLESALDLVLVGTLLWLAWRVTTVEDLFQEAVLFIVFGLAMAFAWARLGAPDIALAEAAIGAGVTGALVLGAVGQLRDRRRDMPVSRDEEAGSAAGPEQVRPALSGSNGAGLGRLAAAGIAGVVSVGLAAVVLALPAEPGGLTELVASSLPASASAQPVTAVLLDFRLYDTWLEIGVLVAAVVAVMTLRQEDDLTHLPRLPPASHVLRAATRLLVPVVVLTAGLMLWLGTHAPGGALQAGAVLGAGGVLLREVGFRSVAALPGAWFRGGVLAAFVLILSIGLATLLAGSELLDLPDAASATVALIVEAVLGFSLGFVLALLFAATQPGPAEPGEEASRWRS